MVRNTYEVQNIGDLLREKRKQLGLDLKEISEQTKIRGEYLVALENGNYEKFASDVYAKGFLKKYAKYLGINPERAAAMYRRDKHEPALSAAGLVLKSGVPAKRMNIELTPGRFLIIAILLLVIVGVAFFVRQVSGVFKAPELSLSEPALVLAGKSESFTTNKEKITIVGKVDLGSTVTLNDSLVNVGRLQAFELADLPLQVGENSFQFKARNQIGQETVATLVVFRQINGAAVVAPVDTPNSLPISTLPERFPASVEVFGRETFVQITVDKEPFIGQNLASGQIREFSAKNDVSISVSRANTVRIKIDSQIITLENTRPYVITRDSTGKITVTNT